jgi:hypothetical protein
MTSKQIGLIDRAHELAKSGKFEFVYQIERQLITEGYARVAVTFGESRELRHAVRDDIKASSGKSTLGHKAHRKP